MGGTISLVSLAATTSWLRTIMSTNITLETQNRLLQEYFRPEAINPQMLSFGAVLSFVAVQLYFLRVYLW